MASELMHVALMLEKLDVDVETVPDIGLQCKTTGLVLPDGCLGVLLVFESEEAATAFYGKPVPCEAITLSPAPTTGGASDA